MDMPHPVTEMPEPAPFPPVFVEDEAQQPAPMVPGSDLSSVPPSLPLKDDFATPYADVQEGPGIAGSSLARPGIPRRRSSLKHSSGRANGERSKVVSWAMDNDWTDHMSKFDHIAYATEIAGTRTVRPYQCQYRLI